MRRSSTRRSTARSTRTSPDAFMWVMTTHSYRTDKMLETIAGVHRRKLS
ncbi:hypothetical protein L914_17638 [Phytophthora nicotianae]|uniref:Uncharacterized protein n=1 Tax=Phytophthora nicotianae TaxID=4792 RepID=W2MIG5_PHYNI|nr:hypothetical protein L914_17638 [Phytophthora nicotianae]